VVKSATAARKKVGAKANAKPVVRRTQVQTQPKRGVPQGAKKPVSKRVVPNMNNTPKLRLQESDPAPRKPNARQNGNGNGNGKAIVQPTGRNQSAQRQQQQLAQRQPAQRQQQMQQPAQRQQTQTQARPQKGSLSEIAVAIQTANAIAMNRTHPRQAEVVDLLRTHEKGWVENKKFMELLRGMVF